MWFPLKKWREDDHKFQEDDYWEFFVKASFPLDFLTVL